MRGLPKRLGWLLFAITLVLLFLAAAPSRSTNGGCLFCGRSRSEAWFCGMKIKDRIQETQGSAWIDQMYPNHTNHIWGWGGTEHKRWGFGHRSIGCGGLGAGAIGQIHYLRSHLGEDRAREFLQRYHSQLRKDEQQLHRWLRNEFQTLFPPDASTTNGP